MLSIFFEFFYKSPEETTTTIANIFSILGDVCEGFGMCGTQEAFGHFSKSFRFFVSGLPWILRLVRGLPLLLHGASLLSPCGPIAMSEVTVPRGAAIDP